MEIQTSSEPCGIRRFNNTRLEFNDYTYTWVIEDFKNFRFYNSQSQLISPVFVALSNGRKYKFQLLMHCDENNDHVQVECKNASEVSLLVEKKVCVKFSIIDSSNKEIFVAENFAVLDKDSANLILCSSNIAKISDVMTDRVLNKGNLTLDCRVRFHNSTSNIESNINPSLLSATPKPSILDDLENLFKSKQMSDAKLIVGNEEFQVHKFVLAFRSPVFSRMFEADMRENRENTVKINDITPEIMREVLRFIYTDKANFGESLPIMDLLAAADKYQIETLRIKCLEVIVARISVDNVAEVLAIVDRYDFPELRKYALYFLTTRRAEIVATNNWDEMISSLSRPMLKDLVTVLMK